MANRIIDRGRGPEIQGTRITVYCTLDFVLDGSSPAQIAEELELTRDEVQAALDYIAAHRAEVEAEYARLEARAKQGNPAWVEAGAAKSVEELKQRIMARRNEAVTHAPRRGQ